MDGGGGLWQWGVFVAGGGLRQLMPVLGGKKSKNQHVFLYFFY